MTPESYFVAPQTRLWVGSLNHAPGDAINPQRPIAADANNLLLLPLLGGTDDMAGLAVERILDRCRLEEIGKGQFLLQPGAFGNVHIRKAVKESAAVVLYSWQPETLNQHIRADHVQHEATVTVPSGLTLDLVR